jgi:hypothetical protein
VTARRGRGKSPADGARDPDLLEPDRRRRVLQGDRPPARARAAEALLARLRAAGPVAVYDFGGGATAFAALHDLAGIDVESVFVQEVPGIGASVLGRQAQPVTELAASRARTVFVPAFDAGRAIAHVRHLLPAGARSRDARPAQARGGDAHQRVALPRPAQFATNLALFRDEGDVHTRLVTANYWAGYGARGVRLWCRLFAADGATLATWTDALPDAAAAW